MSVLPDLPTHMAVTVTTTREGKGKEIKRKGERPNIFLTGYPPIPSCPDISIFSFYLFETEYPKPTYSTA